VVLALFVYCQLGHAQFRQPAAGDSIQDAIKANASNNNAQPPASQQPDHTSTKVPDDFVPDVTVPYLARMKAIIFTSWHQVISSSGKDKDLYFTRYGTTVIEFTLAHDGNIQNVKIVQSSDQVDLDTLALQAISLSSPLPSLPKGFDKKELKQTITFRYRGAKRPLPIRK